MSPRTVRRVVVAVCLLGIGGMVAGSVADDNNLALTFGLITAAAVACLMVATAVAGPRPVRRDEARAAEVEQQVAALVVNGADEQAVRALVREAVRLGQGASTGIRDGEVGAGVHGGRTPRPDR